MSLKFCDLPLCIVVSVLCDWSTMKQLGFFDKALCNHFHRNEYLHIWHEDTSFQTNNNGSTLTNDLVRWAMTRGRHVSYMNFDKRRNLSAIDPNSQNLLLFNAKRITAIQSTTYKHTLDNNPIFWSLLNSCVHLLKLDITITCFKPVELLISTRWYQLTDLSLRLPKFLCQADVISIANNLSRLTKICISTYSHQSGYPPFPDVDYAYQYLMLKNKGIKHIECGPIQDTETFLTQVAVILPNIVTVALYATTKGYHTCGVKHLITCCSSLKRFRILPHHLAEISVDYHVTQLHISLECYGSNNNETDICSLCDLLSNVPITRLWIIDNILLSDAIIQRLFNNARIKLTNACFSLYETCSIIGFSAIVHKCPNLTVLRIITRESFHLKASDEEIMDVFKNNMHDCKYEYLSIDNHLTISTQTVVSIISKCPRFILSNEHRLFRGCPSVKWDKVVPSLIERRHSKL